VSDDLERAPREEFVGSFVELPQHSPGGTEKDLSEDGLWVQNVTETS
jgi:hypothetical protein